MFVITSEVRTTSTRGVQVTSVSSLAASCAYETVVAQHADIIDVEPFRVRLMDSAHHAIQSYLARRLGSIPQVEAVLYRWDDGLHSLWSIIPTRDRGVRERIHELEAEILDQFSDCQFDFYVVSRDGKSIEEIAPSSMQRVEADAE